MRKCVVRCVARCGYGVVTLCVTVCVCVCLCVSVCVSVCVCLGVSRCAELCLRCAQGVVKCSRGHGFWERGGGGVVHDSGVHGFECSRFFGEGGSCELFFWGEGGREVFLALSKMKIGVFTSIFELSTKIGFLRWAKYLVLEGRRSPEEQAEPLTQQNGRNANPAPRPVAEVCHHRSCEHPATPTCSNFEDVRFYPMMNFGHFWSLPLSLVTL